MLNTKKECENAIVEMLREAADDTLYRMVYFFIVGYTNNKEKSGLQKQFRSVNVYTETCSQKHSEEGEDNEHYISVRERAEPR